MKLADGSEGGGRSWAIPAQLEIVAEEREYVVVNKAAHQLVHPTKPTGEVTVWHRLCERYPGEQIAPVNRLDRETSGLMVVARGADAAGALGRLVMARRMEKEYLGLILGRPLRDHGMIEAPIGWEREWGPVRVHSRQSVTPRGAAARTEYWVLRRGRMGSMVRVRLHTGRLHQIRVHLAHIGHPIVGDKLYGPDAGLWLEYVARGWTEEMEAKLGLRRHALHAARLGWPWGGEARRYEARMPDDLVRFWEERMV